MICKLKDILDERMMKQSALAKRVGITETTMSKIVKGETEPKLSTALKIAEVLGMSVHDIWIKEKNLTE
jgi:putative transcriptional regulator